MIYLKSILAGFAALLVTVIVLWAGLTVMFTFVLPRWGSGSGGIGAVSLSVVPILGVALAIFALGFYVEFRRASRRAARG
jgi:hypothetical protein